MTPKYRYWFSSVAACAVLSIPAIALAQSAPAAAPVAEVQTAQPAPVADSSKLEEVIVTSQKRKENLQTVPISVTAFTAAAIENQQQRDTSDLTGMVPNFQLSLSGSGPGASLISLRGISFQDIEKSFEPPIGVVVDGVYLATSTGQVVQTFDFQDIEVNAGPQGTLFGKNTTGGVVQITRTKPDPDADGIHGKVRLTGGSFGRHDGEAVITAPLIQDVLAIKVAAFSQNDDGAYKDVTLGKNVGDRNYQAFSVGLDYKPVDNADLYLIYDRTTDHSQLSPTISALTNNTLPLPVGGFLDGNDTVCSNPFLPGACVNASGKAPSNVTTNNQIDNAGYELDAITLNASYKFDQFKLYSITGYRYSTEASNNDYDSTQYSLFRTYRPESYRQFSEELRLESDFQGPFNFVAGAYAFNSDYTLVQLSQLDIAAVAPIPLGAVESYFGQYTHQSSLNQALFVDGHYDITDNLKLVAGARQSWDEKRILFSLYSEPQGDTSSLGTQTPGSAAVRQHSWAQFTPRVGLQYQFAPDLMGYFTYSKGYNSGGFNGRAGSQFVLGPYAPEQVHSYEVGLKSDLFDHRLRVNLSAFQVDYNNAQEEIIVAVPIAPFTSTTVENAAQVQYQGVELSVQGKPLPNWTVTTNFGYLNAKYQQFNAALLPGPATDNTGLVVRRTPPFTVGFDSDYHVPVGPGEFGVNARVTYIDEQQFDLLNDPRGYQGPVTKADISLRYDMDIGNINWEASAFVKNLSNSTPNNSFVTGYQGSFVEFWAQEVGRTYGVSLQAKF